MNFNSILSRFFCVFVLFIFAFSIMPNEVSAQQSSVTEWVDQNLVLIQGQMAIDRLTMAADQISGGQLEDNANNSSIIGLPLFYREIAEEIRSNGTSTRNAINIVANRFSANGFNSQTMMELVSSARILLS
jgi:hypothetical protein